MNRSEKFWDMLSHDFDRRVTSEWEKQVHNRAVENSKKYLKAGDTVLDYGCATGSVARKIAGLVKVVHGIDISSKMIEAAKRKTAAHVIENVDFMHSTIFAERLMRESFNVILAFNILHLVEDTGKVMQRINELLKPGGLMISSTVCLEEKKTPLGVLASLLSKLGFFPYIRFFKVSELEDLMTNANFQMVETEGFHSQSEYSIFIVARKI